MILDKICKCEGRPLDGKQPFLDRNDLDPGRDLQAFGINVSRYFTVKILVHATADLSCPAEMAREKS